MWCFCFSPPVLQHYCCSPIILPVVSFLCIILEAVKYGKSILIDVHIIGSRPLAGEPLTYIPGTERRNCLHRDVLFHGDGLKLVITPSSLRSLLIGLHSLIVTIMSICQMTQASSVN